VSADAAARAGADLSPIVAGSDPRHALLDDDTRLRLLADVVPVSLPLRSEVVSAGDVLVTAGAAQLVLLGMLRPRRGVPPLPPRSGPPTAHRLPDRLPDRLPERPPDGRRTRRALPPLPGRSSRRAVRS
jgi:hypothetical protein